MRRSRSEGWASRLSRSEMLLSGRGPASVLRPWAQSQKLGFFLGGGQDYEILNFMVLLFIACRLLHRCFQ